MGKGFLMLFFTAFFTDGWYVCEGGQTGNDSHSHNKVSSYPTSKASKLWPKNKEG